MTRGDETPDAFGGTAYYYAKYRPGIPDEVVQYMQRRFDLDGTGTLLDMGCGTGLSTLALAPLFERTVAFDTNAEMLAAARQADPGTSQIDWQQRSDKDVVVGEGPYRVATACRSFNWMDQNPLLDKLHATLTCGGGVALIGDGSFWTGDDPWQALLRSIIQRFLGEDRRAGKKKYSAPTEPYTTMLTKAGYSCVEYEDIPVIRTWTTDTILGYLYSTSFSARELYGDRLVEFEATMPSELLASNGGLDHFVENAHFVVQSGIHEC